MIAADFPSEARQQRASFLTLRMGGQLRGCIGTVHPERPLATSIAENAYRAAFEDKRFLLVTEKEAPRLKVESH